MSHKISPLNPSAHAALLGRIAAVCFAATSLSAAEPSAEYKELQEQNRLLREQAKLQQQQIDSLKQRVDSLAKDNQERDRELAEIRKATEASGGNPKASGSIVVSGEGAFSLFAGAANGKFPNDEFRVDEARLFLEAQLRPGIYLQSELILAQREALDENFHLGEFYVDFENALGGAVPDRLVNIRAGRVFIPFGEEYQNRKPIDDPLISHSVTDFWGIDEGVEIYGESNKLAYALAVQNGGISRLRDWDKDKSVTARVSWAPISTLQLSGSWMRTGNLSAANEFGSEMWIGNNVFRSLGGASTTRVFSAELAEVDAKLKWKSGYVLGAYGSGSYDDDDTAGNNHRSFDFYQLEAVQTIVGDLYAAARYSVLDTDKGLYLAGIGNFEKYFLGSILTKKLGRLGLGLGYRLSDGLHLKMEYTLEDNKLLDGSSRTKEDQVAAQLAVKF